MKGVPITADIGEELANLVQASRSDLDFEVACADGLRIDPEYFRGAEEQIRQLAVLAREWERPQGPGHQLRLFARLRQAFSVHPGNPHLRRTLMRVVEIMNGEEGRKLADALAPFTAAHISCQARLSKAQASVSSFTDMPRTESHIIVVGSAAGNHDGMSLTFDDGVLVLPVPDTYEFLVQKVLCFAFLAEVFGGVKRIAKFDDDVLMTNRHHFECLKDYLAAGEGQYHGLATETTHANFWHGWHIGKCADSGRHRRGFEFPLPPRYATGGNGYFLGPAAISALSYAFLAHSEFNGSPQGWAEDALVGLHLHLSGIALHSLSDRLRTVPAGYRCADVPSTHSILESHVNADWDLFQLRLARRGPDIAEHWSSPGTRFTLTPVPRPRTTGDNIDPRFGACRVRWEVPEGVPTPLRVVVGPRRQLFAETGNRVGEGETGVWVLEGFPFELLDGDGCRIAWATARSVLDPPQELPTTPQTPSYLRPGGNGMPRDEEPGSDRAI